MKGRSRVAGKIGGPRCVFYIDLNLLSISIGVGGLGWYRVPPSLVFSLSFFHSPYFKPPSSATNTTSSAE